MKKIILLFLCFVWLQYIFAQTEPKILDSKIEKVIVFVNGAQTIREAKSTLTAGKTELVFRGISPYLSKESIRLEAEGKLTVLSVVHQPNHLVQQKKREEIEVLQNQKDQLKDQISREESYLAVYQQEEKMLAENQEIRGDNTGLSVASLKEAVDFHRQRLTEVKLKQLELKKKITDLKSDLLQVERQLIALNAEKEQSTSEILVKVNAEVAGLAKFKISYFVDKAGWYPNYDLRVNDIKSPIQLNYKANVYQSTGEDWEQVKLTLSNSNPTQSGTKPELETWYLTYGYPKGTQTRGFVGIQDQLKPGLVRGRITDEYGNPLPGVSVFAKGTSTGTITDSEGYYTMNVEEGTEVIFQALGLATQKLVVDRDSDMNVTLSERAQKQDMLQKKLAKIEDKKEYKLKKEINYNPIPVTTRQNQTSVSFDIDIPYTIPTDGKTYTVEIQDLEVPATYTYYCAPKIDPEAFLTAQIANWEEYNLLDGEANLFFEGAYLGKSQLSVQNLKDTLSLSLGRDKNVVITRTKQKDFTRRRFLGGARVETLGWEIQLRNTKKEAIDITIEDQFPVSTRKEIEVKHLEWSQASLDEDTGKLTWKLTLNPGQEQKLSLKYEVKYPKGKLLVLE